MRSPIYLRDLKDDFRAQEEDTIRNKRPELVKAMEDGKDIQIGEYFGTEEYKEETA